MVRSPPMELRHLRYYVAVAEALNFTRAAARLRVAQPALSRQIRDLEDEVGVPLLRRGSRGVTLTPEGKFFLEAARRLLADADDSVQKVRALARGELGELHVGYAPSPTIELLPPALAVFQKSEPRVGIHLHDLAGNEFFEGLRSGRLDLALMQRPQGGNADGLLFECLRRYPLCVAVAPGHPLARSKTVPIRRLAAEKLVVFRHCEFSDYHHLLDRVFTGHGPRPGVAVECDSASSLFTAVEARRGVAVLPSVFARVTGRRLKFRRLTPAPAQLEVGICRAAHLPLAPAASKFCEALRRPI